jgi:adenosylcobinamide-GDP ribazoletransferase
LLRFSAIASFDDPHRVAVALIVAHSAARAVLPAFMRLVPNARADGLSSAAGAPPPASIAIALALGLLALAFGFGPGGMLIAILVLTASGFALARLAISRIGGQTGDVLGTFEQVAEAALLLIAAALL